MAWFQKGWTFTRAARQRFPAAGRIMRITLKIPARKRSIEVLSVSMSSKAALLPGTVILIILVLAVVRFLVHEPVRFVEISAILAVIILVLTWLVARKSGRPGVRRA